MSNENKLVTRTCNFCKEQYTGSGKYFCSYRCKGIASRTKTSIDVAYVGIGGTNFRKLVTRTCNHCGKAYTGFGKMFCSKICRGLSVRNPLKTCQICGNILKDRHSKYFCSNACHGISRIGIPSKLIGYKWDHISPLKGKKMSDETRKKMSEARLGKTHNFKGEEANYFSKHQWVYRRKGKASECTKCGKTEWIQWSNIDHKYRRVLEDYVALCPKCHKKYDMDMGLTTM